MAREKKDFAWDQYKVVDEMLRSEKGDVIRVARAKLNGKDYVDVRNFYLDKTDELRPGKGIAIPENEGLPIAIAISIICSYSEPLELANQVVELVEKKVKKPVKKAKKLGTKKPASSTVRQKKAANK